ncbi:MAG: TPM domain-containing protein [Micavibrio sp.]|nr:TPM domain-containing protein [Micavibrio sp.]
MPFQVTDKMREDVRKAVEELERQTTGEMVCVIAQSSARYVMFPLFWAAFLALLSPVLNPLLALLLPQAGIAVTFAEQGLVFALLCLLFTGTPLRHKLTPAAVRLGNCHRYAFEQFFTQRLNETGKRSGVMLFVSVDERYVELIADRGINDKVQPGIWSGIVNGFIADIHAGRVHEGYLKAITSCKEILTRHFPEVKDDINELGDNLIELPKARFLS